MRLIMKCLLAIDPNDQQTDELIQKALKFVQDNLTVVNVHEKLPELYGYFHKEVQFEDPSNLSEGKEWIQNALAIIPEHISTQFVTRVGFVRNEITHVANKVGADLIILGNHQDFFGKLSGNRGIVNDVKADVLFINLGK